MDPRIAWFQPEQLGPANSLWMQIWETTQGVGNLYFNNNYSTGCSTSSQSPKLNSNEGNVNVVKNGSLQGGTSDARNQGMSNSRAENEIAEQQDFIPLEANNNHNNRAAGRGGGSRGRGLVGGVGVVGVWRGGSDVGHRNKRKRDNKASTFGFNSLLHSGSGAEGVGCDGGYTGTPWKTRNYSEGILG